MDIVLFEGLIIIFLAVLYFPAFPESAPVLVSVVVLKRQCQTHPTHFSIYKTILVLGISLLFLEYCRMNLYFSGVG